MGDKMDSQAASPVPSPLPGIGNPNSLIITNLPKPLTNDEKRYLLAVERGDLANVRRILQRSHRKHHININCVDSLGRGALTLSIDGENLEMVELLIIMGVETKDALLQAINAEFVEAVELLLEHEELIHKDGDPYSWQKVDINTAMFTPDITPLILAAHRNNYEILKILLDRGATVPVPHDIKCGCEHCLRQSSEDSLRHSLSRVNEYKALASPSLIALSSNDPLMTAFELSWDLRNLAFQEQECKSEYVELRRQCQQFAVDLLDQSRSSQELAIILNHDPESPPYMDGDHMKLARLELAINYKQKKFVAHPNIQQLLAALWYEGVPGFRRLSATEKALTCVKVAVLFPLYCLLYMIAPTCSTAELMRKPFMKFLVHASSYLLFLFVLILVSQRAEVQVIQLFGTEAMQKELQEQLARQRGNGPTYLELVVVLYVLGYIWEETQEIWAEGIRSYLRNMWNFIDFSRNFLYCMVAFLRTLAYIQQTTEIKKDPSTAYIAREHWDDFDPQLIAEGLFAAANIFSALKLVHLFSINPHLGPLQISLGRMVIDILKFFCIYSLVLLAFACGLNQLLWYFADLEKQKCYVLPNEKPDWDNAGDACMKWRRFGNLFESSQSLFWASFGMVGLENFDLAGIKSYTRFWGLLMFGSYSVINVIVLLNLLIAMMSNSYAMIDEHSDTEWKFARTKLWMSYFEDSATLPPPFNIFPSMKMLMKLCGKSKKNKRSIERHSTIRRKEEKERDNRYSGVMRSLVWRYVSAMHRKEEESAVTEDDINEVKMEISSMRYEILEVFEKNGMDISGAEKKEKTVLAKKMKVWERRLMKDFHVAPVHDDEGGDDEDDEAPMNETGLSRFKRVAQKVVNNSASRKWGQVISDVGVVTNSQIGRCRNRQSFKNQQNLQRAMEEARRLVARSPTDRSGSVSPIDMGDEASDTLMTLLKNIAEEMQEISPAATLCVDRKAKKGHARSTTPVTTQMIQELMVNKSPLPTKVNMDLTRRSPSPNPIKSGLGKSTEPVKSPTADVMSPPVRRVDTPKPLGIVSPPPPVIQVTEPEPAIEEQPIKSPSPVSKVKSPSPPPPAAEMVKKSPVKKQPAPVPESSVVSRPVPLKSSATQGMIPPPPSKKEEPSTCGDMPHSVAVVKPPAADAIITIPKTPARQSPVPVIQIIAKDDDLTITMDASGGGRGSSTGSLEKLVPGSSGEPGLESFKAASSPPCLRPVRRIEDVTTIKRQPKSGWL